MDISIEDTIIVYGIRAEFIVVYVIAVYVSIVHASIVYIIIEGVFDYSEMYYSDVWYHVWGRSACFIVCCSLVYHMIV